MQPRHVYVHVPFCARRCAYCDFSIAVRKAVPVEEYVTALSAELSIRFGDDRPWTVDTLYFGGGTPSRLGAEGVERAVGVLRDYVELADDAEVTLEANPEDVTADAVAAWRGVGVNRLSIGAQSFDDNVLEWMHRTHDAAAIGRAFDAARSRGIATSLARSSSSHRTYRSTASPSSHILHSVDGGAAASSTKRQTNATSASFSSPMTQ